MEKVKKSGPAIFINCLITFCIIISAICFILHYGNYYKSTAILWTGITTFTIMYHLWLRIIMGNILNFFKKYINYKQWWFKQRKFENKLYKFLKVKKWKGKALTYNPELFSLKENTLEQIANSMAKVELDHWINELISISTLLFASLWGQFWIFLITAIAAMVFDAQFIIIQRYNRPRIAKILDKNIKEK